MIGRIDAVAALAVWLGATMLLSELRWCRRLPLVDRLAPFAPEPDHRRRHDVLTARRLRDVLGPLAVDVAQRLSSVLGLADETAARLERTGSRLTVAAFRTRQMGAAVGALAVACLGCLATAPPTIVVVAAVGGAPALAFLLVERRLERASTRHRERVFRELAVVAEQLGMLISSGHSVGAAVERVGTRGRGACARDLARVTARIAQGVGPDEALREWAALVQVPEVDQVVSVLALHNDAGDLGRLVGQEARSIRRERHRRLLEEIETRNQQVWIPVTVATLVPGVIFLSIPFTHALQNFGAL